MRCSQGPAEGRDAAAGSAVPTQGIAPSLGGDEPEIHRLGIHLRRRLEDATLQVLSPGRIKPPHAPAAATEPPVLASSPELAAPRLQAQGRCTGSARLAQPFSLTAGYRARVWAPATRHWVNWKEII